MQITESLNYLKLLALSQKFQKFTFEKITTKKGKFHRTFVGIIFSGYILDTRKPSTWHLPVE